MPTSTVPTALALHQRLRNSLLNTDIEWRLIQHTPNISSSNFAREEFVQLTTEVSDVKKRVPHLDIITPKIRPNTQEATEEVTKALLIDTAKGMTLLHAFYEALWLNDLDISNPEIIQEILSSLTTNSITNPSSHPDEKTPTTLRL